MIRFHQLLFVLAILSSCYAPDVKDCTVTCEGPDDCADGQACTNGYCVADGQTCSGSNMEHPDAPIGPQAVMLHVQVSGSGRVDVSGASSCASDCMVMVAKGSVTLKAVPSTQDKPFDKWTSMACGGQPATCTLNVVTATTVQAKFH